MSNHDLYDLDYFERGIMTGKSLYANYQWMPEMTLRMAHYIIRCLQIKDGDRVLDFGCAKGFLVKALRILGVSAWGCDISHYAIANCDSDAKPFCILADGFTGIIPCSLGDFDWIISKDVLEHMDGRDLDDFILYSASRARNSFHVIPLGNEETGKFIIPEYDRDTTHFNIHGARWWGNKFSSLGWRLRWYTNQITGIKENWTSIYPEGNGFFALESKG